MPVVKFFGRLDLDQMGLFVHEHRIDAGLEKPTDSQDQLKVGRIMDKERIDRIIDHYQADPSYLIQVMLDIQSENNWLPKEALEQVSERLAVPLTRIQHIATFYKAFSLVPKGRHGIHICVGTACHVRGATRVLDAVQELTGIKPGETDLDLKFSLETVNCLGCCALGPVMEIDGKTHGKVAPGETAAVLKTYE
jgi:NADH-quinone oxidoreductase subunit E